MPPLLLQSPASVLPWSDLALRGLVRHLDNGEGLCSLSPKTSLAVRGAGWAGTGLLRENAGTWSTTSESQVIGVRAGHQEQSPLRKTDPSPPTVRE